MARLPHEREEPHVLRDREAGERATELLGWVKATVEGDQLGERVLAPDGLDDGQAARWAGIAVLLLRGFYRRGFHDPTKTVRDAFAEMWGEMVDFRENPPDES